MKAASPSRRAERGARVDFLRGEAAESEQPPMCSHKPGCEMYGSSWRIGAQSRSRRGSGCSSANRSEPVESIALARDLSALHLRGRVCRLQEGRLLACLSTRQGCFRMLLQQGGANTSRHWESYGRGKSDVSRLNARSHPGSGAEAGPRWLQAGKGQTHRIIGDQVGRDLKDHVA